MKYESPSHLLSKVSMMEISKLNSIQQKFIEYNCFARHCPKCYRIASKFHLGYLLEARFLSATPRLPEPELQEAHQACLLFNGHPYRSYHQETLGYACCRRLEISGKFPAASSVVGRALVLATCMGHLNSREGAGQEQRPGRT